MNSRTIVWAVTLLAASAPLQGCGLHGKPNVERKARSVESFANNQKAPPPAERGEQARPDELVGPQEVVSPGVVEPWGDEVNLSAPESGWIAQVAVKEGERVQEGQLMAVLDDAAQQSAVELAKADLAEAEAAWARIQHGATPEELRRARAEYQAASARGKLARLEEARTSKLHEGGAAPDAEVDRAAAEAQVQAALASGAQASLDQLERGARAEDRDASRARLAGARARLQLAQANLAHRRVQAPRAGTVLLSRYHVGEFIQAGGAPFFLLGDLSQLQIRLEVDEIDALSLAPNGTCTIYSDSGVRLGEGTIRRLAPRMGRRALPLESPTARSDVRVREVFVEVPAAAAFLVGQRVWGHVARGAPASAVRSDALAHEAG
jgi:HlyD family secretion protein